MRPLFVCVFLAAALILATGCAGFNVERKVESNIFSSSYPKVKVRVSAEFEYMGNMSSHFDGPSMDASRQLRNYFDNFIFVVARDGTMEKAIFIMFETIETHFVDDFWRDVENRLASGKLTINNHTYSYYTRIIFPSKESQIARHINRSGGYVMPDCALSKTIGRIESLGENLLFQIMYLEAANDWRAPCRQWAHDRPLTGDEQKHLKAFNERFESSFQFIDPGAETLPEKPFEIIWDPVIVLDTYPHSDKVGNLN